jgi:hypothetical protein
LRITGGSGGRAGDTNFGFRHRNVGTH